MFESAENDVGIIIRGGRVYLLGDEDEQDPKIRITQEYFRVAAMLLVAIGLQKPDIPEFCLDCGSWEECEEEMDRRGVEVAELFVRHSIGEEKLKQAKESTKRLIGQHDEDELVDEFISKISEFLQRN